MNGERKYGAFEVFDLFRKRTDRWNNSKKYAKINQKIIENSDILEDLKFFNRGKEIYTFRQGGDFEAVVTLKEEKDGLRLSFEQCGRIRLFIEIKNPSPLEISPKKIGKCKFVFKTDSIFLDTSEYKVNLKDSEGILVKDLKLNVLEEGEKDIPQNSVFVEKNNPKSNFPGGDFLLIRPEGKEIPKSPVNIISDRSILEEINKASLFKQGLFKEVVSGDKKWCLLLPKDR